MLGARGLPSCLRDGVRPALGGAGRRVRSGGRRHDEPGVSSQRGTARHRGARGDDGAGGAGGGARGDAGHTSLSGLRGAPESGSRSGRRVDRGPWQPRSHAGARSRTAFPTLRPDREPPAHRSWGRAAGDGRGSSTLTTSSDDRHCAPCVGIPRLVCREDRSVRREQGHERIQATPFPRGSDRLPRAFKRAPPPWGKRPPGAFKRTPPPRGSDRLPRSSEHHPVGERPHCRVQATPPPRGATACRVQATPPPWGSDRLPRSSDTTPAGERPLAAFKRHHPRGGVTACRVQATPPPWGSNRLPGSRNTTPVGE